MKIIETKKFNLELTVDEEQALLTVINLFDDIAEEESCRDICLIDEWFDGVVEIDDFRSFAELLRRFVE